jgi:hypothetical protein
MRLAISGLPALNVAGNCPGIIQQLRPMPEVAIAYRAKNLPWQTFRYSLLVWAESDEVQDRLLDCVAQVFWAMPIPAYEITRQDCGISISFVTPFPYRRANPLIRLRQRSTLCFDPKRGPIANLISSWIGRRRRG